MKRVLWGLVLAGSLIAQSPVPSYIQIQEPQLPRVIGQSANYTGIVGQTTLYYWIVARYSIGNANNSASVAVVQTDTTGSVAISWVSPNSGVTGYDVLRTTTLAFPSNGNCIACVVASNQAGTTVTDTIANVLSDYTGATYVPRLFTLNLDNTSANLLTWNVPFNLVNTIGFNLIANGPVINLQTTGSVAPTINFLNSAGTVGNRINWTPTTNIFTLGTRTVGGSVIIQSGAGTTALTIDSTQVSTFASTVVSGGSVKAAASGVFQFGNTTNLMAPSNGNLTLFNAAQTDFSLLQFGGTTSAFPAIKRATTGLRVRLADDSGDSDITARSFVSVASTVASAATTATTTGFVIITGTTAINTISSTGIPAGTSGCIQVLPQGLFTYTTAGNIGLAGSAVVGRILLFCFDTGSNKFWPSY